MISPFNPFGWDHWAVLGGAGGAAAILLLNARKIREARDDRLFRYALGTLLLLIEVVSFFHFLSVGILTLPLQLCDLALLVMAWTLFFGGNRFVAELAFYWGLAGSLQAVLTPDLEYGFPSLFWFYFFVSHTGVVLGAVYLAVRGGLGLTPVSVLRIWLVTNLYVAAAGAVNWRFGTNLGYLAAKPDDPSLLDYLGPWPWYIFWGEWIGLGLFALSFGFSRVADRFAGKERRPLP
jgi:hypothetical integral membrane protein (TIGR02206 family)